jgi:hypothetical protein
MQEKQYGHIDIRPPVHSINDANAYMLETFTKQSKTTYSKSELGNAVRKPPAMPAPTGVLADSTTKLAKE